MQSHLSIAQASCSFKPLNKYLPTYTTTTFITEAFCLATYVQLLKMTVEVNVLGYRAMPYSY